MKITMKHLQLNLLALVSTTSDEINNENNIGMNDDAFYTSADLDQQPQLPDLLQHHCTPVDLATSALLEINHTVGPEFEENHHQQPPTPPSYCTLTQIFKTVSSTVLTSFSALWSQIQPQEAITELEIELNITSSPSAINDPGDLSYSSWGNNNDGTSLAGPSLGTSHGCLLGTFIGTSLAVGIGTSLSLGASPSTLLGTLLGTSLESVTMSHWQQQHLPPATTTPHDYIEFRTTVAVTAVEIENEKKVVKLDADDNAMKGRV